MTTPIQHRATELVEPSWPKECDSCPDKPKPTEAERLQMLVDIAKESHELAKIMKDFADKNPKSLMLRDLDK